MEMVMSWGGAIDDLRDVTPESRFLVMVRRDMWIGGGCVSARVTIILGIHYTWSYPDACTRIKWNGVSILLGNQADAMIRWKLLEYFLVYKLCNPLDILIGLQRNTLYSKSNQRATGFLRQIFYCRQRLTEAVRQKSRYNQLSLYQIRKNEIYLSSCFQVLCGTTTYYVLTKCGLDNQWKLNMRAWRRIKENETASQSDGKHVRMIRAEGCVLEFIWILVSGHMEGACYHLRVGEVEIYPGELSLKRFSRILKRDRITQAEIGKKQSISSLSPSCTEHGYVYKALLLTTRTFCVFSTSHVCH